MYFSLRSRTQIQDKADRRTLYGLLGTLTSPHVMMMVCLMGLVGMYTQKKVPSPLSVI